MDEKFNLKNLKKQYHSLERKYNLPDFFELNKYFDIESLSECETDFLLRRIRKAMTERVTDYLRFLEIILNPANAPIFFFKFIKRLNDKDKENLGRIYERLGNLEIEMIRLDLDYSEENEAGFIKNVFEIFSEIREEILQIIDKMMNSEERERREKGSYFG